MEGIAQGGKVQRKLEKQRDTVILDEGSVRWSSAVGGHRTGRDELPRFELSCGGYSGASRAGAVILDKGACVAGLWREHCDSGRASYGLDQGAVDAT